MMTRPSPSSETTRLIREAVAAARAGSKGRANVLFGRVVRLDPHNEAAWLWYANTAEQPADAATGLRNALRLNPANASAAAALPPTLVRAGIAATKAGERDAAAEYLADATAADPNNETAWLWRAGVTDDPDTALDYLERVLKINPENAHAKQGAAKLRAELAPAWKCPVCEHQLTRNDTLTDICPRCRCVVDLHRPHEFDAAVPGLDRPAVEAAAKRLRAKWTSDPSSATAFALGVAYLNLGFPDEGAKVLQTAATARGATARLRDDVARLVKHQQARAAGAAQTLAPHGTRPNLAAADTPPPAGPRVMVVDDSPTVRRMVSLVLRGAGYQVAEAGDAEHAAALVHETGAPALFILDVNMPGTDGFGLCKHLRADAETARVPVIFLTGKTGLLSKLHGRWVGAAEYITKPFEAEKLLAAVARAVSAPRPA